MKKELTIFGFIIGTPAIIWLVYLDWKLALAITCLMWANNLMIEAQRD